MLATEAVGRLAIAHRIAAIREWSGLRGPDRHLAIACATTLLVVAQALATPPATADALAQTRVLLARGDLDAALRLAGDEEAAGHKFAAEMIRGKVAITRDALTEAADHDRGALQEAASANDAPDVAKAFDALEDIYLRERRLDLMLETANQMLARPADANRALYLHRRGLALSEMHQTEAAWQAFEEALPLARAAGDLALLGEIHRDRAAWIFRYKHDRESALREYDEAIDDGRRAQAWFVVTSALHMSGNIFRDSVGTNLPEALRRYDEALAIARREHIGTAHILKNIGDVYRQEDDVARAEAALVEAVQEADRHGIAEVRWQARNELGMLLRDTDPDRAERYFGEALDLVEAREDDVLLDDFRPGVMALSVIWMNPYDESIRLLMQRGRPADAFFVAERQRARAFLETLSASRSAIAHDVPPQYAAEERRILERIKTGQALLRTSSLPDEERSRVVGDVGRYEGQLTDLRLRLAVEHPSIAQARYPRLLHVADVQNALLGPDESLVSFYTGAHESFAWVVTKGGLSTVALPPAKAIEGAVRDALQELRNPFGGKHTAIDALSRLLSIDGIARLAHGEHLVIVPHGILYDVPLEALVDGQGKPLVERFAISYAPSASSLAYLRAPVRRKDGEITLVAVANPVVAARASAGRRQIELAELNLLGPVPRSADEVRQIAALFGRGARVVEGANATRSGLRNRGVEQTRILHFATHGLIDETRPDRSGLVLTAEPPRDDGLLQARDIYSLHLGADLVTLSACETALGQNVTGEGMIGLTRAFFYAGARSVVASLWDVEDASTARFMQRFYAGIREGQPIDIALQHAKLDLLHRGGPTSSPFYWASFVVSGQARSAIDIPRQPRPLFTRLPFLWIALVVAIAAGAFGYWQRKRRPLAR